MNILGLNAFHGDASAALLSSGELAFAIEEERLNRIKHWAGLPLLSIEACLAGRDSCDLEHIAVSRNPRAHLWRKILRVITHPIQRGRLRNRVSNNLRVARLGPELNGLAIGVPGLTKLHYVEHHRAHLASALFASPFEEAAVVSVDGFGDFTSVMWGIGEGNRIRVLGSVQFPHSLGAFYTAFTQFLGFPKYGDEYKMMGLAAYGEPSFLPEVRDVVHFEGDQCRLNLDYFTHHTDGVAMTWDSGEPMLEPIFSDRMCQTFGPPRIASAPIRDRDRDLAASAQSVLEENYFALLNHVHRETKQKRLCLAGGVALNCAANGKLLEQTPFREVFVQPAANDAGTAIGAALYIWHQVLGRPRSFVMRHAYYGTQWDEAQIRETLDSAGAVYQKVSEQQRIDRTAREIAAGRVVGWFQGRMEFGPRALGNRSILADPRRADMKDILNSRIKHREPFRPFCPSVLADSAAEYFETSRPSPFMVMAYRIKSQHQHRIPAVTHHDGTGRLQTVDRDTNPLFWNLLRRFGEVTGVPVLLNTSFNENEPIVTTPDEAVQCFLRTNMDMLVIGPYLLRKSENTRGSHRQRRLVEVELP